VVAVKDVDQDVVGVYREGSLVEVLVLQVRAGHVQDTLSFSLRGVGLPDEEVLAGFLAQYYGEAAQAAELIPDEILLPMLPDGAEGVAEWLGDLRGKKVALLVPQRGPRVDLIHMATENAAHAFREKQRSSDDIEGRLEELRERLRLPTLPRRIECCDISHLGGGDTVGAIVAMTDGELDKKRYRTFNVRGVAMRDQAGQLNDDYGSMYEVLARRFRRALKAEAPVDATSAAGGRIKGIPQSQSLHLLERFTRVDPNTINYELTVDDPEEYTKPWKVAMPLTRDDSYKIYEYACHEGNEAVGNILRGGRAQDK